jgi:hypothetical protein
LQEDGDYEEEELAEFIATFFAIFYIDDAYLTSQDAVFLQHALTLLVHLFEWVGLQINTSKMQTMICTLVGSGLNYLWSLTAGCSGGGSQRAYGTLATSSVTSAGRN